MLIVLKEGDSLRIFYVFHQGFCHECLPPLVFSLARTEMVKLNNFRDALKKVDNLSPSTKNDEALAKWAYSVVTTRCFGPDENKHIVPMGDMVRWSFANAVFL